MADAAQIRYRSPLKQNPTGQKTITTSPNVAAIFLERLRFLLQSAYVYFPYQSLPSTHGTSNKKTALLQGSRAMQHFLPTPKLHSLRESRCEWVVVSREIIF